MKLDAQGRPVLTGDGSYAGVLEIIVDGADLVARNIRATRFGGSDDPQDNGVTASGYHLRAHPEALLCSLPMDVGPRCPETQGSPLPRIPWGTPVHVYDRRTKRELDLPVQELGPAKPPHANAGIDLSNAAMLHLAGGLKGSTRVDFRIRGGARFLRAATKRALAEAGHPVA